MDRYDNSAKHIYFEGLDKSWDATSSEIWATLSEDVETILDVGANIGLYALIAKAINPNSRVLTFEPSKKLIEKLDINIGINNFEIETFDIALSNIDGETYFYDLPSQTAVASLKLNNNIKIDENHLKYKVKVNRLDSLFEKLKLHKIDLISIDVEMNEPEVLEGMGDLIKIHRPDFIIEVLNNSIAKEIQPYFNNLNYSFFQIIEGEGIIKQEKIVQFAENINHSFNYLIIKVENEEKVNKFIIK